MCIRDRDFPRGQQDWKSEVKTVCDFHTFTDCRWCNYRPMHPLPSVICQPAWQSSQSDALGPSHVSLHDVWHSAHKQHHITMLKCECYSLHTCPCIMYVQINLHCSFSIKKAPVIWSVKSCTPVILKNLFTCVSYAEARNRYRMDVLPSVCHTLVCIKSAERIVMISSPHDSPFILVLCVPRSSRNSDGVTPAGALNTSGV